MTIYATPRVPDDAISVDSGFESLVHVVNVMGLDMMFSTRRMIIYDDMVFSDFAFRINESDLELAE